MTMTQTPPRKRPTYKAQAKLAPLSADRRFVMVGHTVRILVDYDGLQGDRGEVIAGDFGDGKVLVKLDDGREICFLSREVQVIPGGRDMRFTLSGDEQSYLSGRVFDLRWQSYLCSGRVHDALRRRAARVQAQEMVLKRLWGIKVAREFPEWGHEFCTALVPMGSGVAK